MKTLDQSHHSVIANYATFQRAWRCEEEIESYLADAMRDLAGELPGSTNLSFAYVGGPGAYLEALSFPNWDGGALPLLSIGVEQITLPSLLAAEGAPAWRGFLYSQVLNEPARVAANQRLLASLRTLLPPDGYIHALPSEAGYLFTKRLPGLPIDAFEKRDMLKASVASHLIELGDWLRGNGTAITSLAAPLVGAGSTVEAVAV